MSTHYLLVLPIVAAISTMAFFRHAKRAGLHPGKAASIPFIALGAILITYYAIAFVLVEVARAVSLSVTTAEWIHFMLYLFLILSYFSLIRNNWIAIQTEANGRNKLIG